MQIPLVVRVGVRASVRVGTRVAVLVGLTLGAFPPPLPSPAAPPVRPVEAAAAAVPAPDVPGAVPAEWEAAPLSDAARAPPAADVLRTIATGGAPVTVSIAAAGQKGAVTFDGTAGQQISLTISTTISDCGGGGVTVALLRPDRATMATLTRSRPPRSSTCAPGPSQRLP